MSVAKSSIIIGFFTLISRISGFLRDVVMANLIGASYLSDAFFIAFKIPNFFRRLFAEGAFNAAFVPAFAAMTTSDGKQAAIRFASEVLSVLIVVLLLLNAIFIAFMPFIMPLFAPGFVSDPVKFDLTVTLARFCFPYIFFISIVSLMAGVLNSINKFAAPAFAPVLLNICLILGMLYLSDSTRTPAHALAFSVLLAGITQVIWLVVACMKADALPSLLVPKMTEKVKAMLWVMAPAAIGSGVQQLNLLIDMVIASQIPNAVSYLYYADRIVELPIGMIGVAVGTALLPTLSKLIAKGDEKAAIHQMNRGLEMVLLFALPSMFALFVMSDLVIAVIYEHGAFSVNDGTATTRALLAFSVGLPAFLAVKVLGPCFFAHKDTKTPLKIALICVAVNLVLNLLLIGPFGHVGMAMATSAASWVNLTLMAIILRKRGHYQSDNLLPLRIMKMLVASAAMALLLALVLRNLPSFEAASALYQSLVLAGLVIAGLLSYVIGLLLLRVMSLQEIKRVLLKRAA